MNRFILFSFPLTLVLAGTTQAANIGQDGHSDRVIVSDVGGTARWAVDASSSTAFGDGVEDAAILFGAFSDIHFLGDMNGDGLVDKVRISDAGGTWRVGFDLSTPTTFGDGIEDAGAFLFGAVGIHTPVAVADVNGDGVGEVVITDTASGFLNWTSSAGPFAGYGDTTHLVQGMGDVNGDGLDDRVIDLGGFTWHVDFGNGTPPTGTFGDGNIDTGALFGATGHLPFLGDLNNDGLADRVVVTDPTTAPAWVGDLSSGGVFGGGGSFFQPAAFGVAGDQFLLGDVITTIPEPTSVLLLSMGAILVLFGSKRRRK